MKIKYLALYFLLTFGFCFGTLLSCAGNKQLQVTSSNFNYSGYIIVASVAADSSTAPGVISLFSPDGTFVRTLIDYVSPLYASGIGFLAPYDLFVMTESTEDLELFNLDNSSRSVIFGDSTILTAAPLKQIAVSSLDRSVFVIENNTDSIEKFTVNSSGGYSRSGAPFISKTVASCVLDNAWGISYLPTVNKIAVANVTSGFGITIYNDDGSCSNVFNTGALAANSPVAVTYHALSNKLIVALSNNSAIYSVNLDGTSISLIYIDSSIIQTPRSLATDAQGYIYVGNSGKDTIEKLYYNGQGSATRPLRAPLIGPRGFSSNPLQIVVIP